MNRQGESSEITLTVHSGVFRNSWTTCGPSDRLLIILSIIFFYFFDVQIHFYHIDLKFISVSLIEV